MADESEVLTFRAIADFQFGPPAGRALFPDVTGLSITRTSSGRPQQIHSNGDRIVSYGTDGRFTLAIEGGRRLVSEMDPVGYYVTVDGESEPFVRDGRNVFAKFVRGVDPAVRTGDEVVVLDTAGTLLAVGRAEISASAIESFDRGMAVSIREAISSNR